MCRLIRYRSAENAAPAKRVASILSNAKTDALGIPQIGDHQRETLFATFAPVYEIDTSGEYDRFGPLRWGAGELPEVDVSRPTVYRRLAFTRYGGRTLVQLVYMIWQFAYWINLYNALTVKTVLDHYPVASIREISLGGSLLPSFITGGTGPWQAKLAQVDGEAVALDDIEHRILRPLFKDNRIHYAVNCASIGCPTLMPTPVTAAGLQAMLDRCARLYVNHPRGVRADDGGLTVSSIYKWYQGDFGGNWQGVLAHLRRYANPATTQMLAPFSTIHADTYDWQLNDAATGAKTMQEPERK